MHYKLYASTTLREANLPFHLLAHSSERGDIQKSFMAEPPPPRPDQSTKLPLLAPLLCLCYPLHVLGSLGDVVKSNVWKPSRALLLLSHPSEAASPGKGAALPSTSRDAAARRLRHPILQVAPGRPAPPPAPQQPLPPRPPGRSAAKRPPPHPGDLGGGRRSAPATAAVRTDH